jgi:hypothetical protein
MESSLKVSSSDYHHDHVMEPSKDGDWVKYEDVKEIIISRTKLPSPPEIESSY